MKPIFLLAASALALTAGACAPKTPAVRAALECPATQGELTRTSASPDGKACTYVTSGGAEVTLQLVSLQGGVENTLSTIETHLLADRSKPAAEAADAAEKDGGKKDVTVKATVDPNLDAKIDRDVDQAVNEALADAKSAGVTVEVSKDGKHVVSDGSGETRVNLPGIHIVANDNDDTAKVKIGPLTVDAGGDGAIVRMRRDVRMRGEALSPEKRGLRATFIYTGEDLPDGYRFVGYEAGGPKTGPLTVAVVKSKSEGPDGGELYPDVKKLVRRNGGV